MFPWRSKPRPLPSTKERLNQLRMRDRRVPARKKDGPRLLHVVWEASRSLTRIVASFFPKQDRLRSILFRRASRVIRFLVTYLVPLAILLLAVSLRVSDPPWVEQVRLRMFSAYQWIQPRPYESVPVSIIDVEDSKPAQLGQWPWPRIQIARLIQKLTELGAAAIVLDTVFKEPDRTSPASLLPLWFPEPEFSALRTKAKQLPDHDSVLAQAIAEGRVVVGFALTNEFKVAEPLVKSGLAFPHGDPTPAIVPYKGAVVSLPSLTNAASGNGVITIPGDRDEVIRRVPIVFRLRDTLYPSVVAEMLRAAQGKSTYFVLASAAGGPTPQKGSLRMNALRAGSFSMPTDPRGRMWLYDTGHVPGRFIPAWRVMMNTLEPGALAGHLVFVGTRQPDSAMARATPLNPNASAVEVHAQLAEQIILERFLERPDWADRLELWCLFILGLILIWAVPHATASQALVLGSGVILALQIFAWNAFLFKRWLLDPLWPSVGLIATYGSALLIYFWRTHAENRHVRQAFSRYMSPALVERLVKNPHLMKLGGEMKDLTILFADIHNFTTISEEFNAEELTSFINRFMTPMSKLILERNGMIDKYIGDCIMAFWNAPLDDPHHGRNACQAALDMRNYLVPWNWQLMGEAKEKGKRFIPVQIGVGINTGQCYVGNMGSEQRFDFSAMGDPVNLASRLEQQLKIYGVDILIGEQTYRQASDYAILEADLIAVKGKYKAVHIFTLIGPPMTRQSVRFQELEARHQEMLAAYRARQWAEARLLLGHCTKLNTHEFGLASLYTLYSERIVEYSSSPPPSDWEGVFDASVRKGS